MRSNSSIRHHHSRTHTSIHISHNLWFTINNQCLTKAFHKVISNQIWWDPHLLDWECLLNRWVHISRCPNNRWQLKATLCSNLTCNSNQLCWYKTLTSPYICTTTTQQSSTLPREDQWLWVAITAITTDSPELKSWTELQFGYRVLYVVSLAVFPVLLACSAFLILKMPTITALIATPWLLWKSHFSEYYLHLLNLYK